MNLHEIASLENEILFQINEGSNEINLLSKLQNFQQLVNDFALRLSSSEEITTNQKTSHELAVKQSHYKNSASLISELLEISIRILLHLPSIIIMHFSMSTISTCLLIYLQLKRDFETLPEVNINDFEGYLQEFIQQVVDMTLQLHFEMHLSNIILQDWKSDKAYRHNANISNGLLANILILHQILFHDLISLVSIPGIHSSNGVLVYQDISEQLLSQSIQQVYDCYASLEVSRMRFAQWTRDVNCFTYCLLQWSRENPHYSSSVDFQMSLYSLLLMSFIRQCPCDELLSLMERIKCLQPDNTDTDDVDIMNDLCQSIPISFTSSKVTTLEFHHLIVQNLTNTQNWLIHCNLELILRICQVCISINLNTLDSSYENKLKSFLRWFTREMKKRYEMIDNSIFPELNQMEQSNRLQILQLTTTTY